MVMPFLLSLRPRVAAGIVAAVVLSAGWIGSASAADDNAIQRARPWITAVTDPECTGNVQISYELQGGTALSVNDLNYCAHLRIRTMYLCTEGWACPTYKYRDVVNEEFCQGPGEHVQVSSDLVDGSSTIRAKVRVTQGEGIYSEWSVQYTAILCPDS